MRNPKHPESPTKTSVLLLRNLSSLIQTQHFTGLDGNAGNVSGSAGFDNYYGVSQSLGNENRPKQNTQHALQGLEIKFEE